MEDQINEKCFNLLKQRYGDKNIPQNIHWNAQIENLISHKSVRNFLSEPLPNGTIETMVAAAQSASGSSNLNQWSVIAITDEQLKAKLGAASRKNSSFGMGNPYIEQAPVLLMWVADLHRNSQIAGASGDCHQVYNYLDPVLMGTIDVSIAAQNAVIAAESMDLGVVYLGVMRNNAEEVAAILNLPPYSFVVFGMAVGKPDPQRISGIRPRLSQDAVLHYNGYQCKDLKEQVEDYETAFQKFRTENGMKSKTWKQAVQFATDDMAFMEGRENLRGTLEQKGFKML